MKKKVTRPFFLAGVLIFSAGLLTACQSESKVSETVEEETESPSITDQLATDAASYVEPGDFTDLELTMTTTVYTDEDVEYEMEARQYDYAEEAEVTDGADYGDTVYFTMTTTIEGEESDPEETYIDLGYAEYGEAFDEYLIGVKSGDDLSFSISFTEDDYVEDDWIDETIDFSIQVTNITTLNVPDLTEDFIKENLGYDSMEEYSDAVLKEMEASAEIANEQIAIEEAINAALEASTISGYPQELYDESYESVMATYNDFAEMFGVEMDELLTMFGTSESDLVTEAEDDAYAKVLVSYIIIENDLSFTESDLDTAADALYTYYEYDDPDSLKEALGDELVWEAAKRTAGLYLLQIGNVTEVSEESYDDLGYAETEDDDVVILE